MRDLKRAAGALHRMNVQHVLIGLSDRGTYASSADAAGTRVRPFPAVLSDVTGGGDAALAGAICGLLDQQPLAEAARWGQAAAALTVSVPETVSPTLSPADIAGDAEETPKGPCRMTHPDLDIAPEIADALAQGRAVVALESTIIAHGMPYPGNLVTARALEHIIRNEGAMPATIAVLDGRLKVGLDEAELEHVAQSPDMAKASVRDLPVLIAGKRDGATTVASTMRIAAMAGIRVFATGGIGGVHRGVETTGDVSADLTELALSPVAVVSAGAKAILDLPRTLEMLETLSVPVIGYQCDEFPAFYSRSSGLRVPARADSPEEIAAHPRRALAPVGRRRRADRQSDPERGRNSRAEDRSADRRGLAGCKGAGNRRQGRDAVPARAHPRSDRRARASAQMSHSRSTTPSLAARIARAFSTSAE